MPVLLLLILLLFAVSLSNVSDAFAPVPGAGRRTTRRQQQPFFFQQQRRSHSYSPNHHHHYHHYQQQQKHQPLFGISEWRDIIFNFPGTGDDRRLGREDGAPPRSICILPFPNQDALLQGETKQLRLYESRFLSLFEDCMQNHGGVVGMGLLANAGIIQTIPIAEIEAYQRMEGFGIFVTIRVVGRAQLLELVQQEPYIKAVCVELNDVQPPHLEVPNLVASNIENLMLLLSSMEHRLASTGDSKSSSTASKGEPSNNTDADNTDENSEEMRRRINIARLEDRFYADLDNDDDDEDDENVVELDRRARYRQAYHVAMATDQQGYRVTSASPSSTSSHNDYLRTPQELTATSWAAFCTGLTTEEDVTYRIQALDCDNLLDRLKLALHMLRDKKQVLQDQMKSAGISFRNDSDQQDEDSSSSSSS